MVLARSPLLSTATARNGCTVYTWPSLLRNARTSWCGSLSAPVCKGAEASAFQPGRPVQHHHGRRGSGLLGLGDHQEAAAVGGDGIAEREVGRARLEQWLRDAGLERRGRGLYSDGHQLVVRGQVEEFFTVAPPA